MLEKAFAPWDSQCRFQLMEMWPRRPPWNKTRSKTQGPRDRNHTWKNVFLNWKFTLEFQRGSRIPERNIFRCYWARIFLPRMSIVWLVTPYSETIDYCSPAKCSTFRRKLWAAVEGNGQSEDLTRIDTLLEDLWVWGLYGRGTRHSYGNYFSSPKHMSFPTISILSLFILSCSDHVHHHTWDSLHYALTESHDGGKEKFFWTITFALF